MVSPRQSFTRDDVLSLITAAVTGKLEIEEDNAA